MKGPGLRIDLDVRRVWRCAKCGRTARTPGHVASQRCGCSEESPWMALIPAEKREPFRPPPREPLPELDAVEGALPTSPVVEITGVEVAVVVDATVVDQTVPSLPVSVDLPVADQRAVDQIPEPAAAPDAILAPEAVPSVAPETAQPPDEFGAGLGDSPQNPPV